MKLKLVVASMSILGLVSSSAFAAEEAAATTATTTKHKHHHKMVAKHHVAHHQMAMHHEVEEMGAIPVPAPIAPVTMITPVSSIVMTEMTQNLGRAFPCPDWYNRIGVSGGINFDFGKWVKNRGNYQGENYRHFALNDAYLNVFANVNDWTRANLSLSYSNTTKVRKHFFGYSSVYSDNRLSLEQGYFTIGNFDCSPFFLQFGKQFTDFSRYEIHPITRSLTQVLSESLQTEAKIGFLVPMGFHGAVYTFDDPLNNNNHHHNGYVLQNHHHNHSKGSQHVDWGVALGYDHPCECLGYDIGLGYVNSMTAAQDVAHAVSIFNGSKTIHRRVGAAAFYGDVNSGPFSLGVRYTTAVSHFDRRDLPSNLSFRGLNDFDFGFGFGRRHHHRDGARPWAAGVQAGYAYNAWCKNQNVFLGYQTSSQAAAIGIPKNRWLLGYGIDVCKNTGFGLEWDHDKSYNNHRHHRGFRVATFNDGHHHGNRRHSEDLVSLRADVKFG